MEGRDWESSISLFPLSGWRVVGKRLIPTPTPLPLSVPPPCPPLCPLLYLPSLSLSLSPLCTPLYPFLWLCLPLLSSTSLSLHISYDSLPLHPPSDQELHAHPVMLFVDTHSASSTDHCTWAVRSGGWLVAWSEIINVNDLWHGRGLPLQLWGGRLPLVRSTTLCTSPSAPPYYLPTVVGKNPTCHSVCPSQHTTDGRRYRWGHSSRWPFPPQWALASWSLVLEVCGLSSPHHQLVPVTMRHPASTDHITAASQTPDDPQCETCGKLNYHNSVSVSACCRESCFGSEIILL